MLSVNGALVIGSLLAFQPALDLYDRSRDAMLFSLDNGPTALRGLRNTDRLLSERVTVLENGTALHGPEIDAQAADIGALMTRLAQVEQQAASDRERLATKEEVQAVRDKLGDTGVDAALARQAAEQNTERLKELAKGQDETRQLILRALMRHPTTAERHN